MNLAIGVMLTVLSGGGMHLQAGTNPRIRVCISSPDLRVQQARQIASWLLSSAAVQLDWMSTTHCPAGSIVIALQLNTPEEVNPKSLAYSRPFERAAIVVFFDRVQAAVPTPWVANLLGYVLAHEIVHVVEGTNSHSSEGVMKVRWSGADYVKMYYLRLRLTDWDIRLIRAGVAGTDKRSAVGLDYTRDAYGRH